MPPSVASSPLFIEQVHQRLLEAISIGELKPGERIRQALLAERLGVSRQPVSHALQLLKHQGLVRDAGRQGLEVAPVDAADVVALYEARTALEATAAGLAAARVKDGRAGAAERDALSDALARGTAAIGRSKSLALLAKADASFHQALYRLSGNPAIARMMAGEWPHLMRAMTAVLRERGTPHRAWEEHAEITRVVLAGDVRGARSLVTAHLARAGRDLYDCLQLAAQDE